jgi:hypothetical protein
LRKLFLIHKRRPILGAEPDRALNIAVEGMLDVEVNIGGAALFEQHHPKREHRCKNHPHGRARLKSAESPYQLDPSHGNDRRHGSTGHHGQGRHRARNQKTDHNARQHHVRNGIANQTLTPQHQKIAQHSAAHRRQHADQNRRQIELQKSGQGKAHDAALFCDATFQFIDQIRWQDVFDTLRAPGV